METQTVNGAAFVRQNDMILNWLAANPAHEFEPETFRWIMESLEAKPGIFLDVGASTGFFAIPAALGGHKVVAVEPNARVRDRLAHNIQINQVAALIDIVPAAASAKAGKATFYHNPRVPLTSGGSIEAATCAQPVREEVDVITLDSLPLRGVSVIKIDVENHEAKVLAGAMGMISRESPRLVLEANTDRHRDGLAALLRDFGYTWRAADERNMLAQPA